MQFCPLIFKYTNDGGFVTFYSDFSKKASKFSGLIYIRLIWKLFVHFNWLIFRFCSLMSNILEWAAMFWLEFKKRFLIWPSNKIYCLIVFQPNLIFWVWFRLVLKFPKIIISSLFWRSTSYFAYNHQVCHGIPITGLLYVCVPSVYA